VPSPPRRNNASSGKRRALFETRFIGFHQVREFLHQPVEGSISDKLLETLQPMIPIVKIDGRPLLERAHVLEGVYRSQADRSKATVRSLSESADVMFG